jgi:hypothetical protein
MSAGPDTGAASPAPAPAASPTAAERPTWLPPGFDGAAELLDHYRAGERVLGMPLGPERDRAYGEWLRARPGRAADAGPGAGGEVPASAEDYIAVLSPEVLAYHGVEPNDPTVKALAAMARELGLPSSAAAEGLTLALEHLAPQPDRAAEDARIAAELERLGETVEAGAERAVAARDRLISLVGGEDGAALAASITTAEALHSLEMLLHRINGAWPAPEPLRPARSEPAPDQRPHGRPPAPREVSAEARDRLRGLLDAAEAAPAYSRERAEAERAYSAEMRRHYPDFGR